MSYDFTSPNKLPGFDLDLRSLWHTPQGIQWNTSDEKALAAAATQFKERRDQGTVGFYDWPETVCSTLLEEIETKAMAFRRQFQGAMVFGIGGSSLGAQACLQALRGDSDEERFSLHWVTQVDPPAVAKAVAFAKKKRPGAVVISKSGNTVETLSAFFHLSEAFSKDSVCTVTDPKDGYLRKLTTEQGWASFEVPPNVGGRFSVLTPVGLLPCALGGVDIRGLISGARKLRNFLEGCAVEANPAALLALGLKRWDHEKKHALHYLMPYWECLATLSQWYVQLWGESLGKEGRGPTPVASLGTSDQHSLLQLFKEGPRDKVVGFIDVTDSTVDETVATPTFDAGPLQYLTQHRFGVISSQALKATRTSLTGSGVPTYTVHIPRLNAESIGALLFFYETVTAFAGELYGINAYDQPGVEETKRLLKQALVG